MENFSIDALWQSAATFVSEYWLRVVGAVVVFVVGRIVAGFVGMAIRRAMERAKADPALVGFISALARTAIMAFIIIGSLNLLGVPTASAVAVLGAAGLAIAFALQSSLGNFASGIMILAFKPFRIGDFIDAAGSKGTVKDIGIFTTTLGSPDNQKIIVPNGQIMGGTITNVTANDTRRVDLTAGISYGDDIAKAQSILERIVSNHPQVLSDPSPVIRVFQLGDSSVNFIVRPWVKTPDYWNVYWDITRSIKEEFDQNGVSIPFPQRDVHLYREAIEAEN